MSDVASVAAMSSGMHSARMDAEVAIRTLKMAQEQEAAVLQLILKTMQMSVNGVGQNIDVTA